MAVDHAALREIPPPPNAPRERVGDGARIRYFQAPDGRVAGFVGEPRGSWTQVVAPQTASAFTPSDAPSPPLMRVAPGIEAPMAEVTPPPGGPDTTPTGEAIHWFAGPGGSRLGFVREGERWRPTVREQAATQPAVPALPGAVGTPAGPAVRDPSAPSWMQVAAAPQPGRPAAGRTQPAPSTYAGTSGIRGRVRNWWEEAGRNSEARLARKRSGRPVEAAATDAHDRDPGEPTTEHDVHRRRRWASRLLLIVAGLATALVVLTVVSDLLSVFHPTPQRVEQVVEKGADGGLSSSDLAASSFAVQFAWAYLTYDQSNPQQHANALAPFLGPDVSDTWDGTGTQQVATAQAMSVTSSAGGVVDVDVAAYVAAVTSGGTQQLRWLYLSIPVQVQGTQLTITGLPATIPPPVTGTPSAGALSPAVSNQDTQLTQQLTGAMQSFLQAWSSGNATQLSYLETPNAGIQQLGSSQETFVRVANFQVEQGSGETRTSLALVTWADAVTGGQFTQPYTVTWTYSGSRWLISSVRPGAG